MFVYGESNAGQVIESLEAFVDAFDFNRPGVEGSLGRDVRDRVVQGISIRSEDEHRGAGTPWKANEEKYAKWKKKRYGLADAPNARTGGMLSRKSLIGRTTIEPDVVTMIYGTGEPPSGTTTGVKMTAQDEKVTDIEKAYYAHTGQSVHKIKRPFYELDETISKDVWDLIAMSLDHYIKTATHKR
jgi:hypothetical protein